ncbi:YfgM family protein [Agarilytica rhodophyticola]|uniref:YfgM family protein n=1 Tax=Agarilytica rhodophyticola TaxID=1737490 RepID=UPI000B34596C|nr:tetratricopeptide repeat protein [Agarilytica rhodophyticola]
MADHLTEEEQIIALKNWWNEYWKSVVIPIVVVVVGYFGWSTWQDQKQQKASLGGAKYLDLVKVMEVQPGGQLTEQQRSNAKLIATELVDDYAGTLYADQANLILARFAVDAKDLNGAQAFLQRVVDNGANNAIKDLATTRLARVKIANKEYDAALALVNTSVSKEAGYKSLFAEVRGDALAAQGNAESAKTAYREAMENLPPEQFNRRSILQLKIDGADILAGNVKAPAVPVEEKTEVDVGSQAPDTEANDAEKS